MSLFRTISDKSVLVPAGRYFLGDPCYAVPDEHWGDLLTSCDYFNQPVGAVAGAEVLAFSTAYGDGSYHGSDGHYYPVDAGLIGLVPAAFALKYPVEELERCGRFVTFSADTVCSTDGSCLVFGDVSIETGCDEEDDEDRWDDDDEEGGE